MAAETEAGKIMVCRAATYYVRDLWYQNKCRERQNIKSDNSSVETKSEEISYAYQLITEWARNKIYIYDI